MSTDAYLARLVRRDWLLNGPLSNFITSYIKSLQSQRYARGTMGAYLRCLAYFSYWMKGEGLTVASVDESLIERAYFGERDQQFRLNVISGSDRR
ncbi:hypothetical protein IHE33_15090 (plasmid) [Mycetohabitans endofungorum]|uniref:hypothetical protein n=1 Tax=Mycetohabitans endofungorum TaxID=417203 RepID=UPI0030CB3717